MQTVIHLLYDFQSALRKPTAMNVSVVFDRRKKGKNGSFELYIYVSRYDFAYLATKITIPRNFYDAKLNRVSYRHQQAGTFNRTIDNMVRAITDAWHNMTLSGKEVTCKALIEAAVKPQKITLNSYMKEQFELDKPLLSPGRIKHVKAVLNDFDAFGSFTLDEFTGDVLRRFHNHLLTKKQSWSTGTNHGVLKKYITRAHQEGLVARNVYQNYKIPPSREKRIFLNSDELDLLRAYKGHPRLERVRDVFLFMCLTGLAYSDMDQLSWSNVVSHEGRNFIIKNRQKTNITQTVPLFDEALKLMQLNTDGRRIFSSISGQKINQYLKELAAICNIRKEITSHSARHTFATILLTRGVPLESVSTMLGHKNLKTTMIYGQIVAQKLTNDMERLGITGI